METTTIMNNVETKVKKVSLNGQGVKYMAFGNLLIERQVAGGLMTSESAGEARKLLAMFSSAEEQVEFYAKFASECKEHSKSVKLAIRQHNKPPPKAKAVKVVGDAEKKRGRKKKEVVAGVEDPIATVNAQLVAAAQGDGPIAPPEFVRAPKEPAVATADEKAAEKELEKATKAAEKEAEKAAKAAEKEFEKVAKAAEKELEKVAKAAEKDAEKAAKAAEKAAEAEVKKAAKAAEAETKKVAKESDALANAARSKKMTDEKKAEWIAENERIANCARLAEISAKAAEDEVAAFAKAQQDKAAAVETEKVTKAAAVELAKVTKAAAVELAKVAKAAEKEAEKATKAAEAEAKKAAKAAEAEAKKAANGKATVPPIPVLVRAQVGDNGADSLDEEELEVELELDEFTHNGIQYLIDEEQTVYSRNGLDIRPFGKYDAESKTIKINNNESEAVTCM